MVPTAQELFAFARSIQGESLVTPDRKKPFKVAVVGSSLEFTPGSSKQTRTESLDHVSAILATLAKDNSVQRARLAEISFNSSYVLALIYRWQSAQT